VLFLQHLLNGLLAGAYYLLIALGLSLIFSLGGIVNLAHGAFYAIGAYLAVSIGQSLGQSSSGRWLPRRTLQRRWARRRFERSLPPPRERGTTWSTVARHGLSAGAPGSIAPPHNQHHQPSRSAMRPGSMPSAR